MTAWYGIPIYIKLFELFLIIFQISKIGEQKTGHLSSHSSYDSNIRLKVNGHDILYFSLDYFGFDFFYIYFSLLFLHRMTNKYFNLNKASHWLVIWNFCHRLHRWQAGKVPSQHCKTYCQSSAAFRCELYFMNVACKVNRSNYASFLRFAVHHDL